MFNLGPASPGFEHDVERVYWLRIWPLIEAGKIKPVIYKSFPLAQTSEAHKLMESSQHIGKIVLSV